MPQKHSIGLHAKKYTIMKKEKTQTQILKQLIRARGLLISDVRDKLGVTYPTMRVWLNEPLKMTGETRAAFAKILRIPVSMMDDIVNGEHKTADDVLDLIYGKQTA